MLRIRVEETAPEHNNYNECINQITIFSWPSPKQLLKDDMLRNFINSNKVQLSQQLFMCINSFVCMTKLPITSTLIFFYI